MSGSRRARVVRGASLALGVACAVAIPGARCEPEDEWAVEEAWLTCIDCLDGERAAVRARGEAAVPYLELAVLGPPALRIANAGQLARRAWARIPSPATPESTFVRRVRDGFVSMYQSRAAISLGDIRTPAAIEGLQTALAHDSATADSAGVPYYRIDARLAIVEALDSARTARPP